MSSSKPITCQYYFSVEGNTEYWYLKHLQKLINQEVSTDSTKQRVDFNIAVEKNPKSRVKCMSVLYSTELFHCIDIEGNSLQAQNAINSTIDLMDEANKLKNIHCEFVYSNLSFDLWMILHKAPRPFNRHVTDVSQYLQYINQFYNTVFQDMDDYKKQRNFEKCLTQITLNDVRNAVLFSKTIMDACNSNGVRLLKRKGYSYYFDNPSLEFGNMVKKILANSKVL